MLKKLSWYVIGIVYAGAIIQNFIVQDDESWDSYAFKLTQVSAWLSLAQHLVHPLSPVREPILRPISAVIKGNGRWKRLKEDNYIHSEGFSNLALTLEAVIPALYWALAFPLAADLSGPNDYVSAALLHGAISLALFIDYFINERPFHLLHTFANLSFFLGIYALWNYIGQKAQADPIYPILDWEHEPVKTLAAVGISGGGALITTAVLKGAFVLRDKCFEPEEAQAEERTEGAYVPPVVLIDEGAGPKP